MIELVETHDVDTAALRELRARCEFSAVGEEVLAAQVAGARDVVIARDGERLIGFARSIADGVSNAYVSSVMVDEAYRRRGVASAMMRRLMAGGDRVRYVLHAREAAKDFYRSLGFTDAPDMMWRERR